MRHRSNWNGYCNDSDGEAEVLAQCDVRQAFEAAPHIPAAETSTVAMFNEKLQADLPSSVDIIALPAMDVSSNYPPCISS